MGDGASMSHNVYRPSKNMETYEDLDALISTNRFVPDKEFAGADRSASHSGPVQFEKQQ